MLLTIIGAACFTYLLTTAEPVQLIKEYFGITYESEKSFQSFLARLSGCCICLGFWVGLIATGSIIYGSIVAITAEIICRNIKL